jgi:hypothetical protein
LLLLGSGKTELLNILLGKSITGSAVGFIASGIAESMALILIGIIFASVKVCNCVCRKLLTLLDFIHPFCPRGEGATAPNISFPRLAKPTAEAEASLT